MNRRSLGIYIGICTGLLLCTLPVGVSAQTCEGPDVYVFAGDDAGGRYAIKSNNDGTFSTPISLPKKGTFNRGGATADFDGDGDQDFIGCNGQSGRCYVLEQEAPGSFVNLGDSSNVYTFNGQEINFSAADMNNDGKYDALIAGQTSFFRLLTGNGDNTFNNSNYANHPRNLPMRGKDTADINEDGFQDVVISDFFLGNVLLYLNDGNENFLAPTVLFDTRGTSNDPFAVSVADFNNDGHMDIVAGGSADGIISLWRGDGAGGFVLVRDVHDFNSQVSVDNYDFNNDGNQDLVATVLSSGNVMYLAGNGDGTFDPPVVIGTMDTGGLGIAAPPIPSPPVPLTVSVSGPTEGVRGEELVFTLSAPGGGTVEWSIDWDNDGTIDETITGPSSGTEVLHAFPGEGSFLFNVFAKSLTTCEEGDTSHSVSMQAAVIRAGELIVGGTRGSDRIIFSLWNDGGVKVRIGNETLPDHFLDISRIIAFGGEGNDQITVAGSIPVPVTFYGGGGDDYLAGGPLDDVLSGGPGNDRLLGGEGNNLLLGEEGDDRLVGGSGDDRLEGGSGADQLMGGNGANVLLGGEGDDALSGGNGDDLLLGGEGDDTINGGYGNDILVGNNGDDSLFGKQGDDLIIGGHGADRLIGDAGRDLLISDLLSADEDEAMLLDMHQEWLMGGVPASARSSGPLSDTMIDDVSGGTDIDMFMTSPEDRVRDRDPATE